MIDIRLDEDDRENRDGLDVAEFIRDLDLPMGVVLKSGFPSEKPEIVARVAAIKAAAVLDKSGATQVRELRAALEQAVRTGR